MPRNKRAKGIRAKHTNLTTGKGKAEELVRGMFRQADRKLADKLKAKRAKKDFS